MSGTKGEPSGKFVLRLPRSLHAQLVAEAQREGVSLNQFAAAALAGAVGWRAESRSMQRTRARHKTLSQVRAPRPSVDYEATATGPPPPQRPNSSPHLDVSRQPA